jgi:hypothetical protein
MPVQRVTHAARSSIALTFHALLRYLGQLLVCALDFVFENALLICDSSIIKLLKCGPANRPSKAPAKAGMMLAYHRAF